MGPVKSLFCLILTSFCGAEIIPFKGIARLPAGEAITLQGDLGDVKAEQIGGYQSDPELNGKSLADLIDVSTLKLTYKVVGVEARESNGTVTSGKWSVGLDPLPENGTVTLALAFGGSPTLEVVREAQARVFSLEHLDFSAAKTDEERRKLSGKFMGEAAELVKNALPAWMHAGVKQEEVAGLVEVLDTLSHIPEWVREMRDLLSGRRIENLDLTSADTIRELLRYQPPADPPQDVSAVEWTKFRAAHARFLAGYPRTSAAFTRALTARITTSLTMVAASGVKDFEKYASVDLGVAWIPGIEDLRTFVTINVYLGRVEEKPYFRGGLLEAMRQTVSFTGGYAFADISGSDPQKALYRSNNAFLVGVGLRLNKYFRIVGGTALYRHELLNPPAAGSVAESLQGRLRTAGFVAASIDVTALPNLRLLFGKTSVVKP